MFNKESIMSAVKWGIVLAVVTLVGSGIPMMITGARNPYGGFKDSWDIILSLIAALFSLPVIVLQGLIKDTAFYNFLRSLSPGNDNSVWFTLSIIINTFLGMIFGFCKALLEKSDKNKKPLT